MRAAYRIANLATHHVLGFVIKLFLLVYFAFALLVLFLRYAILPNIDFYKSDIEQAASRLSGSQVSIARIYASWSGLHPNLFLGDVMLRDQQGRQVLSLPSVSARLSWLTLVTGQLRLESLEIIRPDLAVQRSADGKIMVAGIVIDPQAEGKGGGDWILSQREIVIRQGRIVWNDQLQGRAALALDNVNLVLRNKWRRHRFALQATPPALLGAPLDVRANFVHPAFTPKVSNVALWKGELYLDVKNADLAAWKAHVAYPFALEQGHGSVRAWLSLDHARLAGFTADVALENLALRMGQDPDLPLFDLLRTSGRVTASEQFAPGVADGKPTFGQYGHAVSLDNFSLETRDGLMLPPTSLSQQHVPASGGRLARTEVKAKALDLHTLAQLAERFPLSAAQREELGALAPRGQVQDFSAEWQGDFPVLPSYRVKGQVAGLSLQPQSARPALAKTADAAAQAARPALPGFDNLTGSIDANERGGVVNLAARDLVLQMPAYFAEPAMPFERLDLQARWSFEAQASEQRLRVQIDKMHFLQRGLSGTLSGSHVLALDSAGPGFSDFSGTLDNFDVKTIKRYLPLQTPPDLQFWLSGALEDGYARDVSLRLRGDLIHFPFTSRRPGEKSQGEFRVAGRIDNGKLNYAPGELAKDGKAPLWPQAENIKGRFLFERARMEIHGDTARTGGVALRNVKAVIADLNTKDLLLDIDGEAAGPLQQHLNYVSASPVLGWIDNFTDTAKATGNAKLALKLHLPLSHLLESKVQGSLQLQNNEVVLFTDMPPLTAAAGKIEFNEKGVNLNRVGGNFLGGPMAISGGSLPDNSIQIKLAGSVSADGLRKTYPTPLMQRLASHFSGSARYSGVVTAIDGRVQVAIDSSLAGLGLDFPAPVKKAAPDSLPLKFVLNSGRADANGLMRDEINVALGSTVAARYQREKLGNAPWKVVSGGIGVNLPAPQPDAGMMINVNMKSLSVDAWIGVGSAIAGPAKGTSTSAAAGAGPDIGQYVVPDVISGRAGELIVGERKLQNVVVGASHQNGGWQANVSSNQAAGHVSWDEVVNGANSGTGTGTGTGMGKVKARLSSLIIPESAAQDVQNLLEGKDNAQAIPALDIVAERFALFDKEMGRLDLQANNVQTGTGREWHISKLSLANPDGSLAGSGKWVRKDGKNKTSLTFALDILDAGKLLDRFGFADTVRHGKGKLSGDIGWNGLPYSLDIPSLSGQLNLNVESGQFLKQDPGAAKLLGVLSLQALPRLLKLDFRDVFSEGLAFDGITANAQITNGLLKTDNLKMHGVAATVLMDGTADIANETSNLHVVVIPEFNLGTGPLVYALAVNPVIGIGGFLAQLFLRAPMMRALTYQMKITGPWKSPTVVKLGNGKSDIGEGKP
jgi:uncharacterized protein (TIGR02099 family)